MNHLRVVPVLVSFVAAVACGGSSNGPSSTGASSGGASSGGASGSDGSPRPTPAGQGGAGLGGAGLGGSGAGAGGSASGLGGSGALAAPSIQGPQTVLEGATGLSYTVEFPGEAAPTWSVPGAEITGGQGTKKITVTAPALGAGATSGTFTVTVEVPGAASGAKASLPVIVVKRIGGAPDPTTTNLVFNGGFELGMQGFESNKYLRSTVNPGLVFDGPVIETTGARAGARSLRIRNPRSEALEVFGREVILEPSSQYTISVDLKATGGTLSPAIGVVAANWYAHAKTCVATAEWTRCVFPMTTADLAAESREHAVSLRLNWNEQDPASDLWVDNWQIIKHASNSVFGAGAEVEVSAVADQFLYQDEPNAGIITTLINHSDREVHGSVAFRLIMKAFDDSPDIDLGVVDSFVATLAPGERRELTHQLPLSRYGSFTLVPSAAFDATATTLPAWFAAVGRYVPKETLVDLDQTFVVGVNGGLTGSYGPAGTLQARSASTSEYLRLYSAMGGRSMRLWDPGPFSWSTTNPDGPDDYDWSLTDTVAHSLHDAGIAAVPVLGGGWIDYVTPPANRSYYLPAWLRGSSASEVSPEISGWLSGLGETVYLPHQELWKNYATAVATRYAGLISHYEILNEPNLWLGTTPESAANRYLPYLKSASEGIRSADPKAKVVGMCANFGQGTNTFLKTAQAAGAWDWMDEISFHPYGPQSLGSSEPADANIASLLAISSAKPYWNTELYYLAPHANSGGAEKNRARDIARRFLTDLGEGAKQSLSAHDDVLWGKTLNPKFEHSAETSSWWPSANFVAYNALARYFEGARPAPPTATGLSSKIRFSDTSVGYVFQRRDGSPIAAAWVFRPGPDQLLTLPSALAATRGVDVFGNRIASQEGAFSLGQTPVYLVPPAGTTVDAFIEQLGASRAPQLTLKPATAFRSGETIDLAASVVPWPGRTVERVTFTADGVAVGEGVYDASTQSWHLSYVTNKERGAVLVTATALDNLGRSSTGTASLVVGTLGTYGNNGQPWALSGSSPLRIEVENFDLGGEGAGYHDDTGNLGDTFVRDQGAAFEVDLFSQSDGGKPVVGVGATNAKEWLRYTLNVETTGTYTVRLHASNIRDTAATGAIRFEWNGAAVTDPLAIPSTANWDVFTDTTVKGVNLTAGIGILQLDCGNWGTLWDWIEITRE